MRAPHRRRPAFPRADGLTLAIAAIALLGAGLVLAREVTYGVAFTWDSINYLGAARELLTAGDFARALEEREPLAVWPPLYPMLLAAASFGAFDPIEVAGPLGAIIFALTILTVGLWMRSAVASRALVILGCLATACAFPLARLAGFALTDALCILFFLLTLTRVDAFRNGGGRTALTWAAVFTALACLTRYSGVALLFVVLPLLLLRDGPRLRERAREAALYLAVALPPLGLWMVRNVLLVGGPVGDRDARIPGETLPALAGRVFQTLESWLYPGFEATRLERLMNVGTAAVLLALAVVVVAYAIRGGGEAREERRERGFVLVNGTFVFVYVPFLVISALLSSVDANHQRQLVPVLPSLLLLGVFAVGRLPRRVRTRYRARWALSLAALMALGLCLWLSLAALRNVHDIAEANGEGVPGSFTTARWRDSETVRYVRDHRIGIGSRLLSGAALPLYAHTVSLSTHPDARYYHQWFNSGLMERWAEFAGDSYLVRLRWHGEHEYIIKDLLAVPGLELAAELSDGAVFRVTGGEADPGAVADAIARSRRARYEAAVSGELLGSGHFDVHRNGRGLAYVRAPCDETDADASVFLRVFPDDPDTPPDDLGFRYRHRGVRFDGICVATIDLPAYPIARVETGQRDADGPRWEASFPFPDG